MALGPVCAPDRHIDHSAFGIAEGLPSRSASNQRAGQHLGHHRVETKACPESLPCYVIEKQSLIDSDHASTVGALTVRRARRSNRAPLCG